MRASRRIAQQIKEFSVQTKETSKGFRESRKLVEIQWDEIMETFIAGGLLKSLNKRGIAVINSHSNIRYSSENDQCEYDTAVTKNQFIFLNRK